jgi:hypothetical protein
MYDWPVQRQTGRTERESRRTMSMPLTVTWQRGRKADSEICFEYTRLFTNTGIVSTEFFPMITMPVVIYSDWYWKAHKMHSPVHDSQIYFNCI